MNKEKRTLPNGWKWVRLGGKKGIAKIVNGSTPSTDIPEYWNGDILWATPSDLGQLKSIYIEDTERKITKAGLKSCSTTLLPVGTVLLTSRAPVGNLAIAQKPLCTNQGFKSFIPYEGVNGLYLYFAIKYIIPDIQKKSHGNTFVEITKEFTQDFEVPFPPTVDEQIKIAEELEHRLEEVQRMKEAAIKEKDAIAAMQGAILKEVFPFKEGDKLPDGWEWEQLGKIAKLKNGINFDSSQVGTGVLTVDVYNMYTTNVYPNLGNLYRVNTNISDERLLKEKDILFVRSSVKKEGVGWSTVFSGHTEPVCFCGFLIRARLMNTKQIVPEYVVYYFRKDSVRRKFIAASGQSTITNINQENLKRVLIPIPRRLEKQLEIVDVLNCKFSEVDKFEDMIKRKVEAIEAMQGAVLREVFDFHEVRN